MKYIDQSTLLAIRPMPYKGEQMLHDRWPAFVQGLRNLLVQVGVEAVNSSANLLLIYFDEPFAALSTFFESIESLKKGLWQKEWGVAPIQVVLHLHRKKDPLVDFGEATSSAWGGLEQEKLYVTRAMKLQWDQLFAGKKLPSHQFADAAGGVFQLTFSGDLSALKRDRLFTGRVIAAKGACPECFYCGMADHVPAHCPSKQLTMETRALNLVGYLPLTKIDSLFKEVMADQKKMTALLAGNIDIAEIRNNPALQVYVAYFDMYLIYQPRFLVNSAFSLISSWDGAGKARRVKVDSRNLHDGFDCLRVGRYKEAFSFMKAESQSLGGKQFYATLGQAFVALERGRIGDMAHFLQMAQSTASTEKEKIYITLLFARFHKLTGHVWKAEQLVSSVGNLYVDCSELQYSLIQIKVLEGQGQQRMPVLRKMAADERRYFMTFLMDPALLPVETMVENLLSGLIDQKKKEAGEHLVEAREALAQLQAWFGEVEDEELLAHLSVLAKLEEQFRRLSIYDILDVADRAKTLSVACPSLREARLEELNKQVDAAALAWADYNTFWLEYPYQSFFRDFKELLFSGKRQFVEARSIAGDNLTKAMARLREGQEQVELLSESVQRMLKLKIALDTMKVFFKKLMMTELVFGTIAFLALPLITIVLPGVLGPEIVGMVKNPQVQKNGILFLTLFMAPFTALALTIRSMSEQ